VTVTGILYHARIIMRLIKATLLGIHTLLNLADIIVRN